ncbi:MAG: hypothetical protein ACK55I_48275, partial [bacterium]
ACPGARRARPRPAWPRHRGTLASRPRGPCARSTPRRGPRLTARRPDGHVGAHALHHPAEHGARHAARSAPPTGRRTGPPCTAVPRRPRGHPWRGSIPRPPPRTGGATAQATMRRRIAPGRWHHLSGAAPPRPGSTGIRGRSGRW